jgi:drug/metabolite transporter (DMT)-like permease
LVVFGSIVAFSAYRYALHHLPVATVSLYVYVNTVIAILLGTLVLDEPFSWQIGLGAGVVLAAIALVRQRMDA